MKKAEITWYDAYTLDAWQPINEAKEMMANKYTVTTIGWVMEENEKYISICHSYTSVQVMGCLHIPKECIINVNYYGN